MSQIQGRPCPAGAVLDQRFGGVTLGVSFPVAARYPGSEFVPTEGGAVDVTVILRGRSALSWRWCFLLVLLFAPAVAADTPSQNPHLQAAHRLFDALEYEEALLQLGQAEQWSLNTVEDRVSIALFEGVLAYETQQPERGEKAFQRALELNRRAALKLAVSPKVSRRLEELRARLPPEVPQEPPPPTAPLTATPAPTSRQGSHGSLKLPVASGGGVIAVGGMVAWGRAKSLEGKARRADVSITTRAQLEDTVRQGKTFERVGWGLMGLGAAMTAGSLFFLDRPADAAGVSLTPVSQGARFSVSWALP